VATIGQKEASYGQRDKEEKKVGGVSGEIVKSSNQSRIQRP